MIRKRLLLFVFVVFVVVSVKSEVIFPWGADFSYLKGSEATTLSLDWNKTSFDDSSWSQAAAPFWYGDGLSGVGTEMSDMRYSYTTFYLRSSFNVEDVSRLSKLVFQYDYDDGFVLYINGEEVLLINAPDQRSYNSTAPANHESGTKEIGNADIDNSHLHDGENTLAVQVFNVSETSSDVYFDVEISADIIQPTMPDSLRLEFSDSSGFYNAPFMVDISSPYADYTKLKYTLDGSDPNSSSQAKIVDSPAQVLIDPTSSIGRGKTPGVVLRACLYSDTLDAGHISTQTYLFLDQVKVQPDDPGGDWPQSNINDQLLYFGVNEGVATDARYSDKIEDALMAIPTMSLVTDASNLFDANSGVYVNALGDGSEWERPCSIELINPDGSEGFNVDAGLRIRGGWSRHSNFEKHSFRLFFRDEYGAGKLKYALFDDEGTSSFDKIDLRTAQNYAWYRGSENNTMVREVFSRDLQGDMGQPYTRSRYYHLYINGLYFGVYQSQERSEARFAASYMGGDAEDYDVIKVDRDYENSKVSNQVTDGNDDAWKSIWERMLNVPITNDLYYSLIGCNAEGKVDPEVPCMIDVDNLIDYMIGIFYTGNFDSPVSKFGKNEKPNNFYAIYDRTNPLKGYQFMQHDAEHSLFSEAHSPGIGLYEDRVNLHTLTGDYNYNVTNYDYFTPQWIHIRFLESDEYRKRFEDRVYTHLADGGVLSEEACISRIKRRVDELSMAIIGESLRWGGKDASSKLTKDDHWIPEVNKILNDFIPKRKAIFIDQLKKSDIYPMIERPEVYINNELYSANCYDIVGTTKLSVIPVPGSMLAYTLDGTDPRAIGGAGSDGAQYTTGTLSLDVSTTTPIYLRSYKSGSWSAPRILYLNQPGDDFKYLKITELHYHPLDSINASDTLSSENYEFIELKNIHPSKSLNIGGLRFTDGIEYDFPENLILGPQEFYVIASNAYKFYLRYGVLPSGDYKKNLSNGGENIRLVSSHDSTLFEFHYQDELPWVADADGSGYSMVSYETNPISYTPDLTVYWWSSAAIGGSPFSDDAASQQTVLSLPKVQSELAVNMSVFPNPSSQNIQIKVSALSAAEMLKVAFYTIDGKRVGELSCLNNEMINLRTLLNSEGVFFLKVTTDKGQFMTKLMYRP